MVWTIGSEMLGDAQLESRTSFTTLPSLPSLDQISDGLKEPSLLRGEV